MVHKILPAGFLIAALAFSSAASADPAQGDADLLRAATLHKRGDTAAAVAIWRNWAQQGNVDAAYNLGLIHQHADGVAYDPVEALRWYRQAAESGDKSAQFRLGIMYLNGEGIQADEAKAHEWFVRNRREHAHHHHTPQLQQWQAQARALIEERDRREAYLASRVSDAQVLAELRRRAETVAATVHDARKLAAAGQATATALR